MTKYDYIIRYDNSDETKIGGCLQQLDFDRMSTKPFVTIVLDKLANGVRAQRHFINMSHVTHITEIAIEDQE